MTRVRGTIGGRATGLALLLAAGSAAACSGGGADREQAGLSASAESAAPDPECRAGLRPATGAPAEGVWLHDDGGARRVAAIVGPAQARAGEARVTRRVETVEAAAAGDTIRGASDTASVHLQLLPPTSQPAAVYAVGSLVLLAGYEPCGPGPLEPLIRYLRRDAAGNVATDVMLQRASASP